EVVELMQYSTTTHHIKFVSPFEELFIYADKQRIEQVLLNLISNAIKYSYQSEIVNVGLAISGDKIVCSIQDFGIGIRKEQFDNIFLRFYRIEDTPGTIAGLGIGLYISKEIINRHN